MLTPDISETIKNRIVEAGDRFYASDCIASHLKFGEKELLIYELTGKFEGVLQSLLIDTTNDPNSKGTAKRLAKMYINELFEGRFTERPPVTSFPNTHDDPNTDPYQGMLVVRAELKSMCSHHHQPVTGTCYIGILPSDRVIGLSKYTRLAQWCARRGTLQEELAQVILKEIQQATKSRDVGVYINSRHGCCENRGIMSHDSSTTTTALAGQFFSASIKQEFFDTIKLQLLK